MPGFGGGSPWGTGPFGEFPWEKAVLFDSMPEFHRQQDADAGDYSLARLTYVLGQSMRDLRHRIRSFADLRDALHCRGDSTEVASLTLGLKIDPVGDVERRGVDGAVGFLGEFVAETAHFLPTDQGKKLVLKGASLPHNASTFTIAAVVNTSTVIPDPLLQYPEPNALRWEVRGAGDLAANEILVEVDSGYLSQVGPGWVLEDGQASFEVLHRDQFHRDLNSSGGFLEMEGFDGAVVSGTLRTSGAFSSSHVGRVVHLDSDPDFGNGGLYRILTVMGTAAPYTLRLADIDTGVAVVLATEPGPIHWSIWPKATITLQAASPPTGVVEQFGTDMTVTVGGLTPTLTSPSAAFTLSDVGKVLEIRSQVDEVNNALVWITAFIDSQTVSGTYLGTDLVGLVAAGSLRWFLRGRGAGNGQVLVHAPSLLPFLAQDFGIEADRQETDARQRIWVGRVATWLALKGTELGYIALARISGFEAEVYALFRITQDMLDTIPDEAEVELRDEGAGRFGTQGTLSMPGSQAYFTDPSARFEPHDVGRQIRISGAAVPSNDKLYTIDRVLSPTQVRFRDLDVPTLPDANNGSLTWVLLRLYTILPPQIPLYDEIDSDLMAVEVPLADPTKFFAPDSFAWEEDFSTTVYVQVVAVAITSPSDRTVTLSGPANVISRPGRWKFTDVSGQVFWVETTPVATGPNWSVRVHSTLVPVVAAVDIPLTYVCDTQPLPWYVPASKVLIIITDGDVVNDGALALERARERVLLRLRMATPAHVELVPRFRTDITVSTGWGVTVEYGRVVVADIVVPAAPFYDSLPADVYDTSVFYTDTGWGVTITTP